MPEIILMRGIPGSGKSTWAAEHSKKHGHFIFSTDDYWLRPPVPYWFMPKDDSKREYCFDAKLLKVAHEWNRSRCESAMSSKKDVIIDNTNLDSFAVAPYFDLALKYEYAIKIQEIKAPIGECLSRNMGRSDDRKIPIDAIYRMNDKMAHFKVDPVLEAIMATNRKVELDLKIAKSTARDVASRLSDVLEYFEDKYDVNDGDDGEPMPNEEMSLGQEVERMIEELES